MTWSRSTAVSLAGFLYGIYTFMGGVPPRDGSQLVARTQKRCSAAFGVVGVAFDYDEASTAGCRRGLLWRSGLAPRRAVTPSPTWWSELCTLAWLET